MPPAHILLVRQDTHVGSLWLTKLLEAQHISAFFQFDGGQCRPGLSSQPRSPQALFDEGCRCHGPHAGDGIEAKETKEDAFCHGRCGGSRPEAPCKAVLAMGDDVFYKHLRDHNVEPDEAFEEVLKRKQLIYAGESDAYKPPEIGHLILGLLDGAPVPDPAPPLVIRSRDEADIYAPWILNPWQTYLDQKGMANSGVVQAMQAIAVF